MMQMSIVIIQNSYLSLLLLLILPSCYKHLNWWPYVVVHLSPISGPKFDIKSQVQ